MVATDTSSRQSTATLPDEGQQAMNNAPPPKGQAAYAFTKGASISFAKAQRESKKAEWWPEGPEGRRKAREEVDSARRRLTEVEHSIARRAEVEGNATVGMHAPPVPSAASAAFGMHAAGRALGVSAPPPPITAAVPPPL